MKKYIFLILCCIFFLPFTSSATRWWRIILKKPFRIIEHKKNFCLPESLDLNGKKVKMPNIGGSIEDYTKPKFKPKFRRCNRGHSYDGSSCQECKTCEECGTVYSGSYCPECREALLKKIAFFVFIVAALVFYSWNKMKNEKYLFLSKDVPGGLTDFLSILITAIFTLLPIAFALYLSLAPIFTKEKEDDFALMIMVTVLFLSTLFPIVKFKSACSRLRCRIGIEDSLKLLKFDVSRCLGDHCLKKIIIFSIICFIVCVCPYTYFTALLRMGIIGCLSVVLAKFIENLREDCFEKGQLYCRGEDGYPVDYRKAFGFFYLAKEFWHPDAEKWLLEVNKFR